LNNEFEKCFQTIEHCLSTKSDTEDTKDQIEQSNYDLNCTDSQMISSISAISLASSSLMTNSRIADLPPLIPMKNPSSNSKMTSSTFCVNQSNKSTNNQDNTTILEKELSRKDFKLEQELLKYKKISNELIKQVPTTFKNNIV
jgi:hypothetical protein